MEQRLKSFPFERSALLTVAVCLISALMIGLPSVTAQQSTPTAPSATAAPILIPAEVYQTTNVREGPDTRFEILGRLAQDDRVQVFERESTAARWLHVITETGASGWIPAFSVELAEGHSLDELPVYESAIPNPEGASADVTATAYGRVNVRSGPAIAYEIVATLDLDDQAAVMARSNTLNDWLYIETDTVQGWVAYFTVTVTGDPNTLPVLVPDSEGDALISPTRVLRARFNIRLHELPALDSPTLLVIAFNSRVTLLARTEDATWLYVDYDGAAGWGAAELFSTPPDLLSIPVYTPGIDPAPAITPEFIPGFEAEATPEATAQSTP